MRRLVILLALVSAAVVAAVPPSTAGNSFLPTVLILSPTHFSNVGPAATMRAQVTMPDFLVMRGVDVSFTVADSSGTLIELGSVPIADMVPSETRTISVNWSPPAGGTYTLTVRAVTVIPGVPGSTSDQKSVEFNVDLNPPDVTVTSPGTGATLDGDAVLRASATDYESEVATITFIDGDGNELGTIPNQPGRSLNWDSSTVPDGPFQIRARGSDAVGNETTSAPVDVTIANDDAPVAESPPTIGWQSPGDGSTISYSGHFSFAVTDPGGIDRVECIVNGTTVFQTLGGGGAGTYTCSLDLTPYPGQTITIKARAVGSDGERATSSERSFLVDNGVPSVAWVTQSGVKSGGQMDLMVNAFSGDGIRSVELYANDAHFGNGGNYQTGTLYRASWYVDPETFSSGDVVTLRAVATANNGRTVEATITVNLDLDVPTFTLLSGPSQTALTAGTVEYVVEAADAIGPLSIRSSDNGQSRNFPVTVDENGRFHVRVDTTGLYDGKHILRFWAYDGVNSSAAAQRTLEVANNPDNQPPGVYLDSGYFDAHGDLVTGGAILGATAYDNRGVQRVEYRVAETLVATASVAVPQWPGAWVDGWNAYWSNEGATRIPDGRHMISAIAYDAAGNASEPDWFMITVSHDGPEVAFLTPDPGIPVAGTVTVSLSAADPQGIQDAHLYLDELDEIGEAQLVGDEWQVAWDTSALGDGVHSLEAVVRDNYGNETRETLQVTTANGNDVTAPTVALNNPAGAAFVRGPVTATAVAADEVGVAAVSFLLDGSPLATDGNAPFEASLDTATLADGQHTLEAVAADAAHNTSSSGAVAFTVDNTAPLLSFTSPNAGTVLDGPAAIDVAASDTNGLAGGVSFQVNGGNATVAPSAPFALSLNAAAHAPGSIVTVTARATDAAGNTTTATRTFTIKAAPTGGGTGGGDSPAGASTPTPPAPLADHSGPRGERIIESDPDDDQVRTGDGPDVIGLGAGDDLVQSGAGNDKVNTGAGDDRVAAGDGDDIVFGGRGRDILFGGAGDDLLSGGAGRDLIHGGPGDDRVLVADGERDVVRCGPGDDTVVADWRDVLHDCEHVIRVGPR